MSPVATRARVAMIAVLLLSVACAETQDSSVELESTGVERDAAADLPADAAANPAADAAGEAERQWIWQDAPEMRCRDGSATGYAANWAADSDDLLLFLEPGGACYDELTCTTFDLPERFGPADFEVRLPWLEASGLFQATDDDNPFASMNWVFVPYCTADVHAGTRAAESPDEFNFTGHTNVVALLEHLTHRFPNPAHVILGGASAGGFGTLFNFHDVAESFPDASVHLVDDSGPLFAAPWMPEAFQQATFDAWGIADGLPDACPEVAPGKIEALYGCLSRLHPNSRFGLLTSRGDKVNRLLLATVAENLLTVDEYAQAVDELSQALAADPRWATFVINTDEHVLGFHNPLGEVRTPADADSSLTDFLRGVVHGTDERLGTRFVSMGFEPQRSEPTGD